MTSGEYKYEISFSFLASDEQLAVQLNDLLRGRYTTFLYSERQREIAGTDGEESFSRVFHDEARVVVVLYRTGWGATPWTRIEQTAIRNRAYNEGYDFALFVPLNTPPEVPKWLPKTQLWLGLDRWGLEGTASVIEARIQQTGGAPTAESLDDQAERIKRELVWDQERRKRLSSEEGVRAAGREAQTLQSVLRDQAKLVEDAHHLGFSLHKYEHSTIVQGPLLGLAVAWHSRYCNTLDGSTLEASIWLGSVPRPGMFSPFEQPRKLLARSFLFDYDRMNTPGWREEGKDTCLSTHRVVEWALATFLDRTRERQLENGKGPRDA
jgi:hypothetical protein